MNLENKFFKQVGKVASILALNAILSGCPQTVSPHPIPNPGEPLIPIEQKYDYTTTTKIADTQYVDNSLEKIIKINNSDSLIQGTELTIPRGALFTNMTISIGEVNNPPALPFGLNYVGTPITLEPDGLIFNNPLIIKIPYQEESLSDAGISDENNLKLYSYNLSSETWEKIDFISIDTINNNITANINHFSYYAITGTFDTPEDLGIPQPGDLLYTLGAFWDEGSPIFRSAWMPGHVGIYVGEKEYSGTGLASDDVKKFGKYNVVEALWEGVQYSYYDIPNIQETSEDSLKFFSGENVYMGARKPKDYTLTSQQRKDIINYVESQIGKPYVKAQTISIFYGMLRGSLVKGPDSFNCVGLAEKAYEQAGVNEGEGLTSFWQEEMNVGSLPATLTPAEQYNATKPSSKDIQSKIPFVSFTSRKIKDYDSQIVTMNEDGSDIQEITSGPLIKNYPRLFPERDKIIFELVEFFGEHEILNICYMDLDGSGITKIPGGNGYSQPALSIKNKIAFIPQFGLTTLHISDFSILSGLSGVEKLTSTYNVEKTPSFSPDGNYLIYSYNGKDIAKNNLNSRTLTVLIPGYFTKGIANYEPEFSPNGKKIAFRSNMYEINNYDICLYDVASKEINRLTYQPSKEYSPHFSKDGSKIFFVSNNDGTPQIYSMDLEGFEQNQLTFGPRNHDFGYY